MTQPKINIPKEQIDYILEGLSFLALLVLIGLSIFYYGQLPEEIPNHFNFQGEANGYGHKGSIFLLPVIGFFIFILFSAVEKYPHTFNYTKKITEENAFGQYQLSLRLLRCLRLIIHVGFAFMMWYQIRMALGHIEQMPSVLLLVFLCSIFGMIIYYIYKASQLN